MDAISSSLDNNFLELIEVQITTLDAWLYEVNDTVRALNTDEYFLEEVRARLEFIGQSVCELQNLCKGKKEANVLSIAIAR